MIRSRKLTARISGIMPAQEISVPTISANRGERGRATMPITPITTGNSERTALLRKALGEPMRSRST
jgi:hypothetical protein